MLRKKIKEYTVEFKNPSKGILKRIENAVFARCLDDTMELNHDNVFTSRYQNEQIAKLFSAH